MEKIIFVVFATFLATISIVDVKSKMIYDKILIPMAAVGIFLYFKTRDAKFEIPFAPFLAIGAILMKI